MKIIMILILFLTIGCNKNPEVIEQKENIEQKITEKDSNKNLEIYKQIKYTDEEVINKGFYVVTNCCGIYNKEKLKQFLKKEINDITMVYYTEEGDMIIKYIYYVNDHYHVIIDRTRDEFGYKGYYEDEYETLEYDNNIIILKNNVKISGENEKIIYNSIEEHIIRDYEIYEFINKKD